MVAKCSKNINETKWLKGIVGTTVCMQFTETWKLKDAIYAVMTRKPEKKKAC